MEDILDVRQFARALAGTDGAFRFGLEVASVPVMLRRLADAIEGKGIHCQGVTVATSLTQEDFVARTLTLKLFEKEKIDG